MMNKQTKVFQPNMAASTILVIVLAWSAIVQSFALASTQDKINIPIRFNEDSPNGETDEILEQLTNPHVHIHYHQLHLHYDDREENKDPKSGCEAPKKVAKKIKQQGSDDDGNVEYTYESDCNTPSLSPKSPMPSKEPSTFSNAPTSTTSLRNTSRNTASPTTASTLPPTLLPSGKPFGVDTEAPTAHDSHSQSLVPSDSPTIPLRFEKKVTANAYSGKDSSTSGNGFAVGGPYWVVGFAVCITAFVGGFAASRLCSKQKSANNKINDPIANASTSNEWTDSAAASIQLSVEESLDSYCEDWSVSVVSWTPREEECIEVRNKPKNDDRSISSNHKASGAAVVDEIEIEFEKFDLEGYRNALGDSYDEEDPPLFDVIDLSSTASRKRSF